MFKNSTWLLFTVLSVVQPPRAHASVADTFGIGSRSAALGGATVARGFAGYAAWNNPAGLADSTGSRLHLSYGLFFATPNFTDIQGVVLRNDTYTSDRLERGNVQEDYRNNLGQSIGLSLEIAPTFRHLTLGLVAYLPLNQVAYLDTGETFIPEYFMYRARTQRPTFDLGLGAEINPNLNFGIGMHVGFGVTGNANLFLQTDTSTPPAPGSSSTARLITSIKAKAAPYFAFIYQSDGMTGRESPQTLDHSLGLVVRMPVASNLRLSTTSAASVFGGAPGLNLNFLSNSAAYYDPLSIELGAAVRVLPKVVAYLQTDYQFWSKYQEPTLKISDSECTSTGCGIEIIPTRNPKIDYQNVLTPRLGLEFEQETFSIRLGANYRGSIRKGLPTGAGNYLDPPRLTIAGGAGFKLNHFLGFDAPYQIDFHASFSKLKSQKIVKTTGDENGDAGEKVGSPGYTAGGIIPAIGVSLSLAL